MLPCVVHLQNIFKFKKSSPFILLRFGGLRLLCGISPTRWRTWRRWWGSCTRRRPRPARTTGRHAMSSSSGSQSSSSSPSTWPDSTAESGHRWLTEFSSCARVRIATCELYHRSLLRNCVVCVINVNLNLLPCNHRPVVDQG